MGASVSIGRPSLDRVPGLNMALACAPEGGNRPSMHLLCASIDLANGNVLQRNRVFEGTTQGPMPMYYNQGSIAALPSFADGHYLAVNANRSNAGGKGNQNDVKGSNEQNLAIVNVGTDGAINVVAKSKAFAAYQTHSKIFRGHFGKIGETEASSIFLASASPSGVGRGMVDVVRWSPSEGFKHDPIRNRWPFSFYSDSGYMANRYGENPMNQGRDYLSGVGDVPNPGFGREGGFMSSSKTLTVALTAGRQPGCAKNVAMLGIIPGVATLDFEAPINPTGAGDEGSATEVPSTEAAPSSNSGGCAVAETENSMSRNLSIAGLAAAVGLVVSRLRRRSSR
jgi:hypothetical protein